MTHNSKMKLETVVGELCVVKNIGNMYLKNMYLDKTITHQTVLCENILLYKCLRSLIQIFFDLRTVERERRLIQKS